VVQSFRFLLTFLLTAGSALGRFVDVTRCVSIGSALLKTFDDQCALPSPDRCSPRKPPMWAHKPRLRQPKRQRGVSSGANWLAPAGSVVACWEGCPEVRALPAPPRRWVSKPTKSVAHLQSTPQKKITKKRRHHVDGLP